MKDNLIIPVIFTVAFSIGIALFAYFLSIHFLVDLDPQNSQTESTRENNLLNFYEQRHDGDIYILGSSLVREGIDAYLVEDFLKKRLINRSVYVLGMSYDTPLDRACEIDNIISSRPKMVVIGLDHTSLGNNKNIIEDRILLCFQRKQINETIQIKADYQSFFNDDDKSTFTSQYSNFETPFEQFFSKRKFLIERLRSGLILSRSAVLSKIENRRSYPDLWVKNFKDPWVYTTNKTEVEKRESINAEDLNRNVVSEEMTPQKKALLYSINKLQQNNISVIIINMPLDPSYSSLINESTRYHLSNFLNSTSVPWYDYELEFPSESFSDDVHMNVVGRIDFSEEVATRIADNLVNGA